MCANLEADVQVAQTSTLASMSCGNAADGVGISNVFFGTAVTAEICFFHMNSRLERK